MKMRLFSFTACAAALLALALAGCGTGAASSVPDTAPETGLTGAPASPPESGTAPEDAGAGLLLPDDVSVGLPEQEFPVETVWKAADGDPAMLFLGGETEGQLPASLYSFCVFPETDACTFKGSLSVDGTSAYVYEEEAVSLSIRIEGERLTLRRVYQQDGGAVTTDLEFQEISMEEAGFAWADMPLFPEEVCLPVNGRLRFEELQSVPGAQYLSIDLYSSICYYVGSDKGSIHGSWYEDEAGERIFCVEGCTATDNSFGLRVRGIRIGDTLEETAARFANPGTIPAAGANGSGTVTLYGTEAEAGWFGTARWENGRVCQLVYSFGGEALKLSFDQSGRLSEIYWFEV